MRAYLKVIGILLLPLAFVIFYAYSPVQIPPPGWKLSKIKTLPTTMPSSTPPSKEIAEEQQSKEDSISSSTKLAKESLPIEEKEERGSLDSSAHRILFFGDSMVEGLLRRMNCYAFANGYEMTNVVWYSSTTEIWAKTDTLQYFINKVKPTFVMISLGANEQFIKDTTGRETSIRQIVQKLGGTPYVWIGVPAWQEDTGINDLTQQVIGKNHYFDSRGLTLQRGRDHMHPTFNAAAQWMDTVAVWMSSPATAHPIRMNKPTDGEQHTYRTYALQPIKH